MDQTASLSPPLVNGTTGTVSPGRIDLLSYVIVLAQLALITLLLRQFQIESAAFLRVALLAFMGFAVHALLPLRMRLPFFVLLSLASIVVALDVTNSLWIICIGLALIAICHLPISFLARGLLLLASAGLLAAMRGKVLPSPVPDAIWPILGSMFMFRLIVYFYDLRHDKTPVTPARALSYFFLLPNACFPLFPVVDYKTFRRNYFDDDAYRTYQMGVDWMVRGVIHLLLYRFIYLHLTLSPAEVTTPATLTQYLITNFLLYLRVSGLFHLIIGMLYLFGFRLPETHNRYLLASSFTDFWRRINIYWKDFMQKVFYYPALFKLRKLGTTKAMVLATLYVFILTWFLHAYQWFWLRGTALLVWQDVLFWTILGGLVVLNALYELRKGRARTIGAAPQGWRAVGTLTAKRFATFTFICVLWSFWTCESIEAWLSVWSALAGEWTLQALAYPGAVLAVIFVGSIERGSVRNLRASEQQQTAFYRARLVSVVSLVALILISVEGIHRQLGGELATTVHSLRSGRLSRLDTATLERGYYENLLSVDRFNSQLWEVYSKKPANWLDIDNANLKRFTSGFVQSELIPSLVSHTKYGTISINQWGMRDQHYEQVPPPNVYRIAMLGASSVMGWGVGDGETFEAIVEKRLNEANTGRRYEILNFAVPGYDPPHQMVTVEKSLAFTPDAVFYVATGRELSRATSAIARTVRRGTPIPFEQLQSIVSAAGIQVGMEETEALRRLAPHREEILAGTYSHIVARARASGAVPVLLFLPQVREGSWQEETPDTLRIAEAAGFVAIDLSDVYAAHDIATIRLAEWDEHPNRLGHQLVAARLYERLQAKRDVVLDARKRTTP